jgi:hypothetical protein
MKTSSRYLGYNLKGHSAEGDTWDLALDSEDGIVVACKDKGHAHATRFKLNVYRRAFAEQMRAKNKGDDSTIEDEINAMYEYAVSVQEDSKGRWFVSISPREKETFTVFDRATGEKLV